MTEALIPLLTLIALEVILGIDNIIFISILADKLPPEQRGRLRLWGIGLAMLMRLVLLALISWILKLDRELFELMGKGFTGKEFYHNPPRRGGLSAVDGAPWLESSKG